MNWYFFKGFAGESPFHFDDPQLVEAFFRTLEPGTRHAVHSEKGRFLVDGHEVEPEVPAAQ